MSNVNPVLADLEKIAPIIATALNVPFLGEIALEIAARALHLNAATLQAVLVEVVSDPLVKDAVVYIEAALAKIKK